MYYHINCQTPGGVYHFHAAPDVSGRNDSRRKTGNAWLIVGVTVASVGLACTATSVIVGGGSVGMGIGLFGLGLGITVVAAAIKCEREITRAVEAGASAIDNLTSRVLNFVGNKFGEFNEWMQGDNRQPPADAREYLGYTDSDDDSDVIIDPSHTRMV